MNALILFGLGFLGGVLGYFLLLLFTSSRPDRRPNLIQFLVLPIVDGLIGGSWLFINSPLLNFQVLNWSVYLLAAHIGFVGPILISQQFPVLMPAEKEPEIERVSRPAWSFAQPLPVGLVLNGFWAVYGVGTFGGFLAELLILYQDRKKKKQYTREYWIITTFMILASGGLAAIYGISNVSAPVALQLGISTPLIVKRLRR